MFYEQDDNGKVKGVIIVYINDCLVVGEPQLIQHMKTKLKVEFGIFKDRRFKDAAQS